MCVGDTRKNAKLSLISQCLTRTNQHQWTSGLLLQLPVSLLPPQPLPFQRMRPAAPLGQRWCRWQRAWRPMGHMSNLMLRDPDPQVILKSSGWCMRALTCRVQRILHSWFGPEIVLTCFVFQPVWKAARRSRWNRVQTLLLDLLVHVRLPLAHKLKLKRFDHTEPVYLYSKKKYTKWIYT